MRVKYLPLLLTQRFLIFLVNHRIGSKIHVFQNINRENLLKQGTVYPKILAK